LDIKHASFAFEANEERLGSTEEGSTSRPPMESRIGHRVRSFNRQFTINSTAASSLGIDVENDVVPALRCKPIAQANASAQFRLEWLNPRHGNAPGCKFRQG
jgi:hypothetical protein